MARKTHSLLQAAAILGVHRNTLAAWIDKKGCPVVARGDRSRGVEWEIAIPDVVDWRIASAVEDALSGYQDESGKITREEADRRRAVAMAITAEVTADEALDMVVARPEAEADVAQFCLALKTQLANAAARIAARAASMACAPEIQTLTETELNRAFDAASAELAQTWTDGVGGQRGADRPTPQG